MQPDIIFRYIIILIFIIGIVPSSKGQEYRITYTSEGKPLNVVMEDIGKKYDINFAFDPDAFARINTKFNITEASLKDLLELLKSRYSVNYKLIDGTWILIIEKLQPTTVISPKPEPVTFSGFVKDAITGEELIYCNVAYGSDKGAMTNELGFFSFQVPENDSVNIRISHLGYKMLDTIVTPAYKSGFFLNPAELLLPTVEIIHQEKNVIQASPRPESIGFNPLKSSNIPRIANDDLGNSLLIIPGINFLHGGLSGLSIRGGSSTDNLVLFDGIPVLETSHLLGNMSVLNSKFVRQAFVSRGGFGTEFGDRVAGLIEITGKSGKNNQPYLDVSANLINFNLLTNIPVTDKFSVTAAWRRSFIDQWQNFLFYRLIDDISETNDPIRSTIIPVIKYEDINAKVSFHPSENLEFNLNLLYGSDHQSRDFELIQSKDYYRNELLKSENAGMSIKMDWQADDEWFHSLSAGFSDLDKSIIDETGELKEITEIIENPGQGVGKGKGLAKTKENSYMRLTSDIDNGTNHVEEYRADWRTTFNKGDFRTDAGIGIISDNYRYRFFAQRRDQNILSDSIADNNEMTLINGFIQQRVYLNDLLNLRLGIRANTDINSKKTYWQPRGGIEMVPAQNLSIYFLSGVYYQFLSGVKRFDSEGHFNQLWHLPGPDQKGVVKGIHYIAGSKFEKNGWYLDIEAYNKKISGKLNYFSHYPDEGDNINVTYIPLISKERVKGIDLFLQKKHYIFNHMAGYSISEREEKIDNILNDKWFPGYDDRMHRLKITEMITWKNWQLTGCWNYASGLPVVKLTESGPEVSVSRSDHFSQLDLALVREFRKDHLLMQAGASLLNIFNRKNIVEVDYLRFSSDTGSLTVRSDISALGFTPLFFINLKIY